jgi:hypothetical protein
VIGEPLLLGDEGGYNLTRSLRFRSSASASLTRTPATASNRKTFTWSGWVKRGTLSTAQSIFSSGSAGNNALDLVFLAHDKLQLEEYNVSTNYYITSSAVYRDPAAWYHIVVAIDTTQATASNRIKLYVNGVQVTVGGSSYPTQNFAYQINTASFPSKLGLNTQTGYSYFDGYMAEVNFIDGQALAPTAFGTFNSYGVWQPITYGGSYGTNGFRLPFTNNASTTTLGYDFSPQGNNWTTNNISVTAGSTYDSMTDVPTLTSATAANYCVLSPIGGVPSPIAGYTTSTITNGNLTAAYGGGTIAGCVSTIPINVSGSWYWEATLTAVTSDLMITPSGYQTSSRLGLEISLYLGRIISDGSVVQSGLATGSNGDVIGIAYNSSTRTATITKNNAAWATQAVSTTANAYFLYAGVEDYSSVLRHNASFNFGQQPFVYSPPSGYVALNTFNL